MSEALEALRTQARSNPSRVLLPEAGEQRVLKAAVRAKADGVANPVVLGRNETYQRLAASMDLPDGEIDVLEFSDDELDDFAWRYAELRDVSVEVAHRMLADDLVLSGLLTRFGVVDSFVAGAMEETAAVLAVVNGIVGFAPGVSTGSSFFVMVFEDTDIGENGVLIFADCAVNISPSETQLADITMSTARTARELFGWTPRIALLSFSTKGSANHPTNEKIREVKGVIRERDESVRIDGELQPDAALVPDVARHKVGDGALIEGDANVLIFPDLHSGNIGYKLTERLADAEALGPFLQGYARPVSDLSRGASVEDIEKILTITSARKGVDAAPADADIVTSGSLSRREQGMVVG